VPPEYVAQGHCFALGEYETDLIYSFDVCSGCEAHSILRQLEAEYRGGEGEGNDLRAWMSQRVSKATPLSRWQGEGRSSVDFRYCPGPSGG
jgi:hypothetical protein